jgi:Zn-finger nucleic acid-binding protein
MIYRDPTRLTCLRCADVALSPVEIAGIERHSCTACQGTWIAEDQLRDMMVALGLEPDEPLGPIGDVSELACPTCRHPMVHERAYGDSMIFVDVCPDHGAWFDRDELASVIERLHLELASRGLAPTGGGGARYRATPRPRPVRSRGRYA